MNASGMRIRLGVVELSVALLLTFLSGPPSKAAEPANAGGKAGVTITVVDKQSILDYQILWDEECLFNYEFFGLRTKSEFDEKVVFYYGHPNRIPDSGSPRLAAMAEIPLRDGKIHGKVRRWAEDGTLLLEVPYKKRADRGRVPLLQSKGEITGNIHTEPR